MNEKDRKDINLTVAVDNRTILSLFLSSTTSVRQKSDS